MKLAGYFRLVLCFLLLLAASPSLADPPPLSVYGALPGVEDMALSPNGEGIAVIAKVGDERLVLVLGKDYKPRLTAPVGNAKIRGISWAGNDLAYVIISSTEYLGPGFTTSQHEFYGALLLPLNGDKSRLVYSGTQRMANSIFGQFGTRQVGGKWIGYFGGIEYVRNASGEYEFDHGRPALYAVDLARNSADRVARPAPEGHWRDWLIDGEGQVAITLDARSATGNWEITNAQGDVLVSGVDKTGDIALLCLGQDGSTVIYSAEDDNEARTHWFEVPIAGGAPKEILAEVNVKRLYIDHTSGRLLGYLEDGSPPKPTFFDPAKQSVMHRVFRAFPNLHVEVMDWTPDFSRLIVRTSGNGDSGTWYNVDLANRKADPIGNERPLIGPDHVGPVSTVSYRAADGLEMDGVLTLPPGRQAKNLPVILFPHGGPNVHDEAEFDWWAQAFATRGYAVFQPNFRGSTGRDDAFRVAGNGEWGSKMQTDISDGLAELVRLGIVDPRRACIMGASYGGYAALAGVTLQQGLYRCSLAVAPVSDLADLDATRFRESGQDRMVRFSMREQLGDPKNFDAVSPRRHAAQADAPILLIHGKDDTVVNFSQSQAMADALKDASRPYELVVLRQEDHWLSRSDTRQQMLEAAMTFVQRHNPPD